VPSSGWTGCGQSPCSQEWERGQASSLAAWPVFTARQSTRRWWVMRAEGRVLVDDGSCVAVPQRAKPRGDCVRREGCCPRPYRQVEGVAHWPLASLEPKHLSACSALLLPTSLRPRATNGTPGAAARPLPLPAGGGSIQRSEREHRVLTSSRHTGPLPPGSRQTSVGTRASTVLAGNTPTVIAWKCFPASQ
jgi:hypothetical protein